MVMTNNPSQGCTVPVKVLDEPYYPVKVVECTDCITIFRITDDEPED